MLNVFTRVDRGWSNARVQGAAGISTQLGPGVRWQVGPGMHQVATHATSATNHRLHQPTHRPRYLPTYLQGHSLVSLTKIDPIFAYLLSLPLKSCYLKVLSLQKPICTYSPALGAAFKENYSNGCLAPLSPVRLAVHQPS